MSGIRYLAPAPQSSRGSLAPQLESGSLVAKVDRPPEAVACDLCGDEEARDVVVLELPGSGEEVQLCGYCLANAVVAMGVGRKQAAELAKTKAAGGAQ